MPNLEKHLRYIEERLTRVYQSADSKKAATESGEMVFHNDVLYSQDSQFVWGDFSYEVMSDKFAKNSATLYRVGEFEICFILSSYFSCCYGDTVDNLVAVYKINFIV